MSVPPQVIHVKRKADNELPVSYLRVQETKRHRSSIFVYQRQNKEPKPAEPISTLTQKPVIHTSPPSDATASGFQGSAKQNIHPNNDAPIDTNPVANRGACAPDAASPAEPRQFHMSRKDIMLATSLYQGLSHGEVSKKRPGPALFIERKIKRISSKTIEKFHAANNASTHACMPTREPEAEAMEVDEPEAEVMEVDEPEAKAMEVDEPEAKAMEVDEPEPRKFKKPGLAKLAARDNTSKDKPELPKSMMNRWNVDMEQLTADMEAYAMQQIGLNIQRAEEEKREQEKPKIRTPSKLQFKPKPPAKRYADRHPEEAQQLVAKEDTADAHLEQSDSDDADGDYIIETYVRVPASVMGDHVAPQTVGLLVFDKEPELEYFYGEEDDSEDEWAEDEEDENAENYYTADYPDEEVATDDEFDENPYVFRTGNASDLEEYDLDDESSDDAMDEDESVTNQFRTYIGRNGLRSNHL